MAPSAASGSNTRNRMYQPRGAPSVRDPVYDSKQSRKAYVAGRREAARAASNPLPFGPEMIDQWGILHEDL